MRKIFTHLAAPMAGSHNRIYFAWRCWPGSNIRSAADGFFRRLEPISQAGLVSRKHNLRRRRAFIPAARRLGGDGGNVLGRNLTWDRGPEFVLEALMGLASEA